MQGYSAIDLIELHSHSDFMYVRIYIMLLSHWPAMLLRSHGVRKNCKYTIDTPHAPRNFVCAVVSPNVHHKILNMLKNRRAIAEQTIRRKCVVKAQYKRQQRRAYVGCAQPVRISYANDRHTCAIDWAWECSALPQYSEKLCHCFRAHTRRKVGNSVVHSLSTCRF